MAELIASSPLLRLAVLAALFLLVAGVTYMASGVIAARQSARQRLLATGTAIDDSTRLVPSLRADQANAAWLRLVNRIEKTGLSLVDTKDESLRRRLAAAGYTASYAPRVYTLVRLGLVVGLPMLAGFLFWLSGTAPGLMKLWFTLLIAAAMGLYFPSLIVRVRADQRNRQIINGFPDALDLMLVCVEAGLALESAFDRVGKEISLTHPLLAEQIGTVVLELRAGRSREDRGPPHDPLLWWMLIAMAPV